MTAVRYFSRSGNVKAMAEAIAKATGTEAVSVTDACAALTEPVDTLFVGGALYAYGIDEALKTYLQGLDAACVKKAVVFSSSWVSKHAIDLIKGELEARGIAVEAETFYVRSKPSAAQLEEAAAFAKKFI